MSNWRQVALSDVVRRVNEKNGQSGIEKVLTVSAEHGLVAQETYFTKKVASADTSGYLVVRPGQFVYNKSSTKAAPYGTIARNKSSVPGLVSPLYFVFQPRPEGVSPEFLELTLNSQQFFASLRGMLREGARSHGALNVRLGEFYASRLSLPPLPIQERIVEVIGAVDDQVKALDGEVRSLDATYRGLLSSLDERGPAIAIGAIVITAFAGGTPSRSNPAFYGDGVAWLKSGEVANDHITTANESITELGLSGSSAKVIPPGSTVVAMYGQGDTKGRAGFVEAPIAANQAVLALVPNERLVVPRYLLHAVRSRTAELRSRAVGSSQPNLNKALVVSQTVPLPRTLEEQRTLADAADSVRDVRRIAGEQADHLRALRTSLLSALLNREIEITDAERTVA